MMLPAVADAVRAAGSVVVLTGAGISAESGIPTFRGSEGLWRAFRPEDLATPAAFARDPALVWRWYRWRRTLVAAAQPNAGHLALARLEVRLPLLTVLTQNVDGLHGRAGSVAVLELHGNIWRARCTQEKGVVFDHSKAAADCAQGPAAAATGESAPDAVPQCPSCGAMLRPDVVWFGEALDPVLVGRATDAVRTCDVLLIVGTSGVVYPVAALPDVAKRASAIVVEINIDDTPLTGRADFVLRGPAGEVLPALEAAL